MCDGARRGWYDMVCMTPPRTSGLVQVYTGNGKGKTTAALGLALRAVAAGKRVAIIFFDKGGERYSERRILARLGVDWFAYGLDRIDSKTERFRFGVLPEDASQAEQGIAKARELLMQRPPYNLAILDEINTAVALGMISESAVEQVIEMKPKALELVLTGRIEAAHRKTVRPSYFDRADLITEMRLVKHYFYSGTPAREGFDF